MLMVYLLGLGACVSVYFMYKNKKKISFELLRYYTYLDEFITKTHQSKETTILYPNINECNLGETSNLKMALVKMSESNLNYIITKDFLVREEDNTKIVKTFYSLYKFCDDASTSSDDAITSSDDASVSNDITETTDITISNDITETANITTPDDILETDNPLNIIKVIKKPQIDIYLNKYEEYLQEIFFKNQINLLTNIEWNTEIIAASITVIDENKIYTFREYDITEFFNSLMIKDCNLKLDNSKDSKILWLYIFNYLFKSKNVMIPIEENINSITLDWTIVFSDCSIVSGKEINFDLKLH